MGYTVICNQDDRELWLKQRRFGVGASEMPVLLGESEWGSNVTIWARKCGLETEEAEDTELMDLGRELESAILNITAKRAGVLIASRGQMVRSYEHEWCTATPDGITVDGEPVEVKNLSFGFDDDDWQTSIPEKYRIQCHHQMLAMDTRRCLFGVLVWGNRVIWEWVERDDILMRRIIRTGNEFWKYVKDGTEPPADGNAQARKWLSSRATEDQQVEISASEIDEDVAEWSAAQSKLTELRREAKAIEKARDSAANRIAQQMGSSRRAFTADGWSFEWKRSSRKGFTVEPKTIKSFKITAPRRT